MSEQSVFCRMGDVALALGEAHQSNVAPTKIQLQKFIYLTDVLGQIVGLFKLGEGHKTYFNGPYDAGIQNAVNALAFRGLVRIAGTWRTASGHIATKYALAPAGFELLHLIQENEALARKVRVAKLVGAELSRLGWRNIVELVYAEPTFVATRPIGWGNRLAIEDGLSVSAAFLFAIMRRVATTLHPC